MTRRKFIILSSIISAFLIALPFACNEQLREVNYTFSTDKVTSPVKLAFVSDLHNTVYGREMSELISAIDKFCPDAVIFGGDLFDRHWGEPNSVLLVKKLVARYPCLYSLGNHEFNHGDGDLIKLEMSKLGVTVLDGTYKDISANGSSVRILGIDGIEYKYELRAAESDISHDLPNILVNHYPEDFPALRDKGFDLILAGHAHGGQWRLPPLINGVFSPGEGFFPKYAGGVYTENGTTMYVSRGLERSLRDILFPRIFNRPELLLITISP